MLKILIFITISSFISSVLSQFVYNDNHAVNNCEGLYNEKNWIEKQIYDLYNVRAYTGFIEEPLRELEIIRKETSQMLYQLCVKREL